jgi:acyl-CoA synthetase (AMP-forming)/AMP-acid ligase II
MNGLLRMIDTAPSSQPLFMTAGGEVTTGRVRATATAIAAQLDAAGPLYLYTTSASLFVAGLLAAARKQLAVWCPAHLQPHYLHEIGADAGIVLTDRHLDHAPSISLSLASHADEADGEGLSGELDLVFYTSGVTGTPKAVPKRIRQLDAEAYMLESVWPGGARRVFGTVSHQHIYGMLFRIFWPLQTGGVSTDQSADYWEQLDGVLSPDATLVTGPAHLTRLPITIGDAAPGLVFSSGAALPFEAAQAARKQLHSLPIEILGSTQTGGIAWRRQEREDALWSPLPGVGIEAGDGDRLCVRSLFADSDGAVSTGDLFERVGEKFRLMGRADCVAKIDGKRVSLLRVEEALLTQRIVEAAAAVTLPGRKGALGAVVQLNAEGRAALAERGAFRLSRDLRHVLAGRLEPAERPKHWRFETIPLDRQGKRVESLLRAVFDRIPDEKLGRGRIQEIETDTSTIRVELTPGMVWFEGHFPDQPVLAGIAQDHMAVLWRNGSGVGNRPRNVTQLKFRRVLRPGDS